MVQYAVCRWQFHHIIIRSAARAVDITVGRDLLLGLCDGKILYNRVLLPPVTVLSVLQNSTIRASKSHARTHALL